jgi:integrase
MVTRQACIALLDGMNAKPAKRRLVRSYLRQLMVHAMDLGARSDNPMADIRSEMPDAEVHIWEDAELAAMVSAAERIGLEEIATAMLIAHDEGPRPVDILAFQRFRDYTPNDGCFRYFQQKTNEWVVSPAGSRIRGRLAKQPAERLMLVINSNTQRQYNQRVFNRDFDRVRTEAKLPHLQFRHLRHTFVVKAKRAGLDEFEIAAKTGHSPKSVRDMLARHYLPHDSVVASNATVRLEAYRTRRNKERKSDTLV